LIHLLDENRKPGNTSNRIHSSTRLSLTLLEAGILFVDHKQLALSLHDLAINAAFFDGCSYFHLFKLLANSP
jgi:hypothetical protein